MRCLRSSRASVALCAGGSACLPGCEVTSRLLFLLQGSVRPSLTGALRENASGSLPASVQHFTRRRISGRVCCVYSVPVENKIQSIVLPLYLSQLIFPSLGNSELTSERRSGIKERARRPCSTRENGRTESLAMRRTTRRRIIPQSSRSCHCVGAMLPRRGENGSR